jgi:hypothetical protein
MESDLLRLKETFKRMEGDGFDSTHLLLWGFYFVASNKTVLKKVYDELLGYNYQVAYLKKINSKEWQLKVIKEDILTPERLHNRNLSFNELADFCGEVVYDGWDVEKIESVNGS